MRLNLIARTAIAAALFSGATAVLAYDKPPQSPPTSSSGGPSTPGGSSGGPVSVPEPEQFALFALGVAGLAAGRVLAKRRRRN